MTSQRLLNGVATSIKSKSILLASRLIELHINQHWPFEIWIEIQIFYFVTKLAIPDTFVHWTKTWWKEKQNEKNEMKNKNMKWKLFIGYDLFPLANQPIY